MKEIRTTTDIHAPPERVWQVLTDFAAYPEWNPYITQATGRPASGEQLELRLEAPGSSPRTVRPTVLDAEAPRELRWFAAAGFGGLLDTEVCFTIVPKGQDRTHVIHRQTCTGLGVPFVSRALETNVREGLDAMNRALKARVQGPETPGV